MKKLHYKLFNLSIIFLVFACSAQLSSAQCPNITSSSLLSDCAPGPVCTLCVNESVLLQANGLNLPAGGCVKWYYSTTSGFNPYSGEGTLIGCALIASGNTTVIFTPSDLMCNMDFYIVGIVDPLIPSGCAEVFTNEFKIYVSCPEASFTFAPLPVCVGNNVFFNGEGGGSYSWSGPNGFTSMQKNFGINNITAPQMGFYSLTVTDPYGCTDSYNEYVEVTLPPEWTLDPPIDYTFLGQLIHLCGPSEITFIEAISNHTWDFFGWAKFPFPSIIISSDPSLFISDEGVYYAHAISDNGCHYYTPITVDFSGLVINIPPVTICPGTSTEATASTNSGTAPYTYLWNTGETDQSIWISSFGDYKVTVTDADGCTGIGSVILTVNTPIVTFNPNNTGFCIGGDNFITASATNGTAPYTYEWETPSGTVSGNTVNANIEGEYIVLVTDANGCTASKSFSAMPSEVEVSISPDPAIMCLGGSISLTATASGGSGSGYTYQWTTPGAPLTGKIINATSAGIYIVTTTDSKGCTNTDEIEVTTTDPILVDIAPKPAQFCKGASILLTPSITGGFPVFKYHWSTPNGTFMTKDIVANVPAIYYVTVTDSKGCTSKTEIEVNETDQLLVEINPNPAEFCKGDSITLYTNVLGGSPDYLYSWNTPFGNFMTEVMDAYESGNYIVTVTDSKGCSGNANINVGIKPEIIVNIQSDKSSVCPGEFNLLTASTTNIDIINYEWDTPNGQYYVNPINASLPGDYQVTVTSIDGCTGVAKLTIKAGTNPDLEIITQSNILCIGDSINLIANSKDMDIVSYSWITPNGPQTGATIKAFLQGNYIITIENANGCSSVDTVSIAQGPDIQITASPDSTSLCTGGNVLLTASSLTEPLTYQWIFKTDTISGNTLLASNTGLYIVNGTNEFGCLASDSVSILKGEEIAVSILPEDPTICSGSKIKLTAFGTSNSTLSYNWTTPVGGKTGSEVVASDLGVYTITVTDPYGCIGKDSVAVLEGMPLLVITPANPGFCNGQGVEISALVAGLNLTYNWTTPKGTFNTPNVFADVVGTYTVTVTDEGGCSGTTSADVVLYPDLNVLIDPNPASFCGTGSAKLTASSSNGVAPFTYNWNTPAGLGNTAIFNANIIGTYQVVVTDSLGCTGLSESQVTKSNTLSLALSDPGFCPGSSVDISVAPNGGQEPYNYSWQTPIGNFNNQIVNTSTSGSYLVTVTDVNGCTGEGQLDVKEYSVPIIQIDPVYGFCSGKSVAIEPLITDPLSPFTYSWLAPGGNYSTPGINADKAGSYSLTVTNSKGCSKSSSTSVNEWELPEIAIDPNPVSFCKGVAVEVKAIIAKGKTPFSYEWKGPSTNSNANIINVANAGNYNLSITDANGCGSETSFIAGEEPGLNVGIITDPLIKCNVTSFTVLPDVTGGNGIYQYSWQTPEGPKSGININTSAFGQFSLTVTDTKGCTGTSLLVVKDDKLYLELIPADPSCLDPNTGEIEIASGLNAIYPLQLIINGKTQNPLNTIPYKLQKLQANNYVLEFTGANGCKYTEDILLNTSSLPELELGPDVTIYLGESYVIIPQANFTIDSIHWNDTTYLVCEPGCLEPISTPKVNIEYKATAYSKDGCVAKDNLRIYVVEKQSVYVPNSFSPNGDGINDEWIVLTDQTVVKINKMYIYDRWGEAILMQENFPANDPEFGWNGKFRNKLMNPGVYVYYFTVEFKDGRTKEFKGDINLVR